MPTKKENLQKRLAQLQQQKEQLLRQEARNDQLLVEAINKETIENCRSSLSTFYENAWPHLQPSVPFMSNWHVECLCDHLQAVKEGDIQNLIIQVPPGHSKSTIVSQCFPVWTWLTEPDARFITCAHSSDLALRDSKRSRDLFQSIWFKEHFADSFTLKADSNQMGRYDNTKGGYRIATSIEGRGIGERYRYLIVDDPHKPTEIGSAPKIAKVTDWWTGTMSSRAESSSSSRIVMHQRLAMNDLIGWILENEGDDYVNIYLPLEYDPTRIFWSPIGWRDPRKHEGELLWPERISKKELYRLKKVQGIYGFSAQYQQNPVPLEGGIIKSKWCKRYHEKITQVSTFDIMLGSWDLTFDETGDSYSVGTVWGIRGSQKFLIAEYRGKWTFPVQLHKVRQMKADWPGIRYMLVEKKANGDAVKRSLETEMVVIPVNPSVTGGGDKVTRLTLCSPEFESGNVLFPESNSQPWVEEFLNEITTFPRGKFNDRVDSTSQLLNYVASELAVVQKQVPYLQILQEENSLSDQIAQKRIKENNAKGTDAFRNYNDGNTIAAYRKIF